MDVVIPFRGCDSQWQQELRYSLRSLKKHGRNLGGIFIVGAKPHLRCEDGLTHIECADDLTPYRNVAAKLRAVCADKRIGERFLLSNDDFYLTKYVDLETFPYFDRGDMLSSGYLKREPKQIYGQAFKRTFELLRAKGLPTKHYGVHCPFRYEKTKLTEMFAAFPEFETQDLLVRCVYGNYFRLESTMLPDVTISQSDMKRMRELSLDRAFFASHYEHPNSDLARYLVNTYTEQTPWELDAHHA